MIWGQQTPPFVVFTGGEPLLQLKKPLIDLCKENDFYVAVETNGTKPIPEGLDWICVSPKPRSTLVVDSASELKLVYPQLESEMALKTLLHSMHSIVIYNHWTTCIRNAILSWRRSTV